MIDNNVLKTVNLYGGADFMDLKFNKAKIEELMRSFYTLTGIRFVLFDADFKEIAFYPKEKCDFCRLMW